MKKPTLRKKRNQTPTSAHPEKGTKTKSRVGAKLQSGVALKRCVLLFWALYLTISAASNIINGLQQAGWIDQSLTFSSGNWNLMTTVTGRYSLDETFVAVLFVGVICLESLAALLFWRAVLRSRRPMLDHIQTLLSPFVVAFLVWGGFLVADEVFMAFRLETTHLLLLIATLISTITIRYLPDGSVGAQTHQGQVPPADGKRPNAIEALRGEPEEG